LLVVLLVASATAVLAQTPAGTQIRNRSSATYEDLSGNTFSTTSNEVITIVLPVYGLSILPDDGGGSPPAPPAMTQNAIPGLTVYYRYDLTNTGNDNDSFDLVPTVEGSTTMALLATDVRIHHDLNGNGVIDAGEPLISSGGVPGPLGPLAAGGLASIIVSYTVPAGAAAGEVAYVGVDGASVGAPAQQDTRNYHLTTVVNDAVMTANFTGAPPVVFEGNQITYTLSGTNTGNNSANGVTVGAFTGVLLYDVIPIDPGTGNPLPVFGVPTGVPGGGQVLYLPNGSPTPADPSTWAWSIVPAAGDIAVGYITAGAVIPGQSYNFSYQATVPIGMPAGLVNNTSALAYIDNDVVTLDPTIVVSNNAPVTVGTIGDVLIGTAGNPQAGTPPLYNDDVTTVATAYANTSVDFVNTLRNDGNASDMLNVVVDGASTIPGTWSVLFFQADGVTPLVDNGVDGMVDTGPLAVGATLDIVVRVVIPGTQPAGGPPDFDTVIRAESTNDPAENNITTNRISAVVAAGVDIGNYDGVPGTTNDALVTLPGTPGAWVDFPLDVINTSAGAGDTYTLSSVVPVGWTATFYIDVNSNGVLDPAELVPVASTGLVGASTEMNLIARVDVAAGAAPGINPVSFTATSSNNPGASDTIANEVDVISAAAVDFAPDQAGTTTPGGIISYSHTVTNTGNVADTFDLTFVSSQGWSYVFYDALNNPIVSVTLAPGAFENITARLTVPAGATIGTVETGVLTATGQATLVFDTATDITTIVAGNLSLVKSVSPLGDQLPGTDLDYTVDYANVGTDDLTNIVVYDAIPAWTWYQVLSVSNGTFPATVTAINWEFSDDGGATWGVYAPVSGGGGAPAGYDANVTNVRWVFTGNINAGGASIAGLSFTVQIQ